jgi:hypothetical protein
LTLAADPATRAVAEAGAVWPAPLFDVSSHGESVVAPILSPSVKPLASAPEYVRFLHSTRYTQDDADSPLSLLPDDVQAADIVAVTAASSAHTDPALPNGSAAWRASWSSSSTGSPESLSRGRGG